MIQLLSTDFDGTLVGFGCSGHCVPPLRQEMIALYQSGAFWVINTGRPLGELLAGIEELGLPFSPHFAITNERHLYRFDSRGKYEAFEEWNESCDQLHLDLFDSAKLFFQRLEVFLKPYAPEIFLYQNGRGGVEGFVASSETLIDRLFPIFWDFPERPPQLSYQRSANYLRFCHHTYNKGMALRELNKELGVPLEQVMAIGDHHNDLTMFEENTAKMIACPANAHQEVIDVVKKRSGYVASSAYGVGTAEAINFYQGL